MSGRSRIPPLLEALIRLPSEASLLLLTGVVNAAPHWLTLRFLGQFLSSTRQTQSDGHHGQQQDVNVVLVSWLREYGFWRNEAKRGAGIDLDRLSKDGRFIFVDGLTSLFPEQKHDLPIRPTTATARPSPAPARGQPLPKGTMAEGDQSSLVSTQLDASFTTIGAAISKVASAGSPCFLILDSPTFILAANPSISASDLSLFVLKLRSQVHSTLIVGEADSPLIAAAAPEAFLSHGDYLSASDKNIADNKIRITPLEDNHAGFLVGQAHLSKWTIGVRGLDTGVAKDVSGVVAIRRGGAWDEDGDEPDAKETEVLYRVKMDGNVEVFERGAGDVGLS